MNNYISLLKFSWRININISTYINLHTILKYITKYASKLELKSEIYGNIFANIVSHSSNSNSILSFVTKMIYILLIKRDWSVQKVIYYFLRLYLGESSYMLFTLNV